MITNEYFKHYMSVISALEEKIQNETKAILAETTDKDYKKILLFLIETSKNHQEKLQSITKMLT